MKHKKNTQQQKLSVVINTKNAVSTLEKTLQSVRFADEIVIVDAYSTDETVAIAKKYTKHIYFLKGPDYVEPYRNFAIAQARFSWVLVIDADEQIPEELGAIIRTLIQEKNEASAYYFPRKNFIFGTWIQHTGWWPDYQLRLFKKGAVKWQDAIHSIPVVTGSTEYLPAKERYAITHDNYTDVSHFLEKLNLYTSIQAREKTQRSPQDDFSVATLLETFSGEFAQRAFARNGVADGLHGLSLSLLQGMSEVVVYLKQWGEQGYKNTPSGDVGAVLDRVHRIWRYWWADYQVRHTRGLHQLYWRVRRKLKW